MKIGINLSSRGFVRLLILMCLKQSDGRPLVMKLQGGSTGPCSNLVPKPAGQRACQS